jgi:Fe-S oxidoreductase
MTMRIRQEETIDRCRFCFMCRHVCSLARATHEESVTPRSQGLVLSLINRDAATADPDVIKNIYNCTQCRWCKEWCEGGWDFSVCAIAAREALLENGLAPENVSQLIDQLTGQAMPAVTRADTSTQTGVDILLLAEPVWAEGAIAQTEQAAALLQKAGLSVAVTGTASPALRLYLLGAREAAASKLRELIGMIRQSGCQTVVALSPGDVFLLRELPELLKTPPLPDSIRVRPMAGLLAELIADGRLTLRPDIRSFTWHDDDFSARYTHETEALPAILRAIPDAAVAEPVWRGNHARSSGGASAGCSDPVIIARLADMRLQELTATGADCIVTMTADDCTLLGKAGSSKPQILTLVDLAASLLGGTP